MNKLDTTMPLVRNMPLYQQVYTELKKEIISGRMKPGTKISENVLADQFQISRTPLREALRQLQQEGLVVSDGVSTSIMELNAKDFEDLCNCRLILEKEIIKLCIDHISDEEIHDLEQFLEQSHKELNSTNNVDYMKILNYNSQFHDVIINSCGNKRLVQLLGQTRSFLLLYRANGLLKADNKLDFIHEHRGILEAIRERDVHKAIDAIEAHLQGDIARGSKF